MLRALAASTVVAFLLVSPSGAQMAPEPLTAERALASAGKMVVSSDGVDLGRIQGVASESGVIVLLAEMERPLGIGVQVVAIDFEYIARITDRVELRVTADEVRDRLREADVEDRK